MDSLLNTTSNTRLPAYWVVHPLDDLPEQKRDVSAVGPMAMTPSARLSLFALKEFAEPYSRKLHSDDQGVEAYSFRLQPA
jgi:hypothetical protein